MPPRKRAERRDVAVFTPPLTPTVLARPARGGAPYHQGLCPTCHLYHSYEYWTHDFGAIFALGVTQRMGGDRNIQAGEHFGPDQDPQGFHDAIKARVLAAVQEWARLGWVSAEEVRASIGDAPPPPPPPPAGKRKPPPLERTSARASYEALVARIKGWAKPSQANAGRFLDAWEGEHDIDESVLEEARDALDQYRDLERSDFDDAEEYQEARNDAWEEFMGALDAVEVPDDPGGAPP